MENKTYKFLISIFIFSILGILFIVIISFFRTFLSENRNTFFTPMAIRSWLTLAVGYISACWYSPKFINYLYNKVVKNRDNT